jgi:preprotein translocase subunit SecD
VDDRKGNRKVTEILVLADPCNVTGACLAQAKLLFDHLANPIVSFQFNDVGGELFGRLTGDHLPNESTGFSCRLGVLVDGELFSAPAIRSKIGNQGQIRMALSWAGGFRKAIGSRQLRTSGHFQKG